MSFRVLLDTLDDPRAMAAAALLLKVTLLLGAGALVAAVLGRRSAAARHEVWTSVLTVCAALALLGPLAPSIEVGLLPATWREAPASAPSHAAAVPASAGLPDRASAARTRTGDAAAAPARHDAIATATTTSRAPRASDRARAAGMAAILWAFGTTAVMLWCLAGHLGLRRLARVAEAPSAGDDWPALLAEAAARSGVERPVQLRFSDAVGTPVTWGAWRPIVVLPRTAAEWPVERRRAALLHELAHVARQDYLTQLAGTIACALYWFHPGAWMALRRLRLESERACDDRVLASGASPAEYAAQLLEVARGARALRLGGTALAIGMARLSTLEGRLLAVLDERVRRTAVPRAVRVAAATTLVLVLVPLAGLTPVARAAVAPPRLTLAAVASSGGGASELPSIDQSVDASPGEVLHLDLETGAGVLIRGWDQPRVEVRGTLGGRDWRSTKLEIRREGTGVLVRSSSDGRGRSESTSHHLEIHVPRRFDVRIESSGGSLTIADVEGSFRGHTGGGDFLFSHLKGAAKLATGGGDIRVADSTLSGSVSTGGGTVRFSRVAGGLDGSSGSGPVIYADLPDGSRGEGTGDLEGLTVESSGEVADLTGIDSRVPSATGKLHISRPGGPVRLAGAPEGAVIYTGGGDVTVGRSAGLVEAQTGGGDITVGPVAGSVQATTGAGRVEVTLIDAGGKSQSVEVASGSGTVVIELPAGFAGTFELETAYTRAFGRETKIVAPWALQRETTEWLDHWDAREGTPRRYVRARGTVGSGKGGTVRVKTINGDIEVRRAG